ncbi:MAG: hypothetical protein Q8L48_39880 [Archangium sp.]|nr:hypothetical protein [Archangium sp.]
MKFSRACMTLGALTLLLALAGIATTPKTCGDDRGLGPVLGLELAVNASEVSALVRGPDCAAALRENTLTDMVAFIPAFTAFLVCGALMVSRKHRLAVLAVPVFVLGGLSDEVEDRVMLALLELPHATREWLIALFFAVRLKFVLLSLGVIIVGAAVARAERLAGAAMITGGLVALCGLLLSHQLLMPGTLVAWVALLVLAIRWR